MMIVARPSAVGGGLLHLGAGPDSPKVSLGASASNGALQFISCDCSFAPNSLTYNYLTSSTIPVVGEAALFEADMASGGDYFSMANGRRLPGTSTSIYVNGTEVVSGVSFTNNNLGGINIGSAISSLRFQGDIAEVVMYGRRLSSSERKSVEAVLAAKYGLTVAP
jgi:hypothetical protein